MADPMNPIDAGVDAWLADPVPEPAAPGARARYNMSQAQGGKPDLEADLRGVAARTGVPLDSIRADPEPVKREEFRMGLMGLEAVSPKTTQFLTNPSNARVAADDLQTLTGVEGVVGRKPAYYDTDYGPATAVVRNGVTWFDGENFSVTAKDLKTIKPVYSQPSNYRWVDRPGNSIGPITRRGANPLSVLQGLANDFKVGSERAMIGSQLQLFDLFGWDKPDNSERYFEFESLKRRYDGLQLLVDRNTPEFGSRTGDAVYGGVSSLTQQAPGLTMSVLTRNPGPALAAAGLTVESQAYGKYRARGATAGEATVGAIGEGSVEVVTELIPMGYLARAFGKPGKSAFIDFAKGIVTDIPGEQVATIAQDAFDAAIANPDMTWSDYLAQRPDAAYQTFVATITQGGLISALNAGAQRMASRPLQSADEAATVLEQLDKLAAASPLRQRDPQAFEQFVAEASDEGVDSVFINGATFAQVVQDASPETQEILAGMPSVQEQLADAVESGGDIKMPLSEFAGRLAGSDISAAIIENARLSPFGMSRAEGKAFTENQGEELKAEAEKVLAERQADQVFRASSEAVQTNFVDQLNAANRFTPDVNRAYAGLLGSFYTVQAAKLGITPEQMLERYPLRVEAEEGPGARVLKQSDFAELLANAKAQVAARKELIPKIEAQYPKGVAVQKGPRKAFVGPDPSVAGRYRVTYFDEAGTPTNHTEAETYADALQDALQTGYAPRAKQPRSFAQRIGDKLTGGGLERVRSTWKTSGVEGSIQEGKDGLRVSKIVVPPEARGQGAGSLAMRQLLEYADSTGQRVTLTPSDAFGATSVGRLETFYKRLGFKKNAGRSRDFSTSDTMIREPQQGVGDQLDTFFQSAIPDPEQSLAKWDEIGGGKKPEVYTDLAGTPTGKALIGRIGNAASIDEAHAVSDAWVLSAGTKTGVEHLVTFDDQGGLISIGRGTGNFVPFTPGFQAALNSGRVRYITHNHPANSGLSDGDLLAMATGSVTARRMGTNVGAVVTAMGHAGSVFSASSGPRLALYGPENMKALGEVMARFGGRVHRYVQALIDRRELTVNDAQFVYTNLTNILYHHAELIDLRSNTTKDLLRLGVDVAKILKEDELDLSDIAGWAGLDVSTFRGFEGSDRPGGLGRQESAGRGDAGLLGERPSSARRGERGAVQTGQSQLLEDLDTYSQSAQPQTETAEFKAWFGDSKVVDENGQPLVVYHGTRSDVSAFERIDGGNQYGDGFYFTTDPASASNYATGENVNRITLEGDADPNVMPVYLAIKKPYMRRGMLTNTEVNALEKAANAREPGTWKKGELWRMFDRGYQPNGDNVAYQLGRNANSIIRSAGYDGYIAQDMIVVFEPTAIKSAIGNDGSFDASDPRVFSQAAKPQVETPEFKTWFEDSKVVDAGGRPLVVYHGTTGDFDVFDLGNANPESDMGAGFYFTTEREDVAANYAGEGPDLTQKIDLLAEQIAQEEDLEYDDPEVRARAKEQLRVQHGGMTLPVYLSIQNPVVIAGADETFFAYEESYDEETDDYGEPDGALVDFAESLRNVLSDPEIYDADADQAIGDLLEEAYEGLTATQVLSRLKESEGLMHATDDSGKLIGNELVRRAFEEAGYDGVIDNTVDEKFGSQRRTGQKMAGMTEETVHYIAFSPEQIKSAIGNDGSFDANDPSILSQDGDDRGQIAFGEDITQTPSVISLLRRADLSTFLHETGHFFLEVNADLASRPDAPAEVVADMGQILKWFGVESLDAWRALTLEEKRPYHEQFARGTEAYLFEGKAPGLGLRELFQKFRSWLLNVYRSMASLNVELTPEVRSVFDRMLATSEEIRTAEDARGFAPLFASKPEGMTDEEWTEYQALGRQATADALTELDARSLRDMKWLSNAKSRALKDLQRDAAGKRKAVRDEVTAEVQAEPVYRSMTYLKRGQLDGEVVADARKLSIPALKQMFEGLAPELQDWQQLGYGQYGMLAEDGMSPDEAAETFGFSSGRALVEAMLNAEPMADKIAGLTDQRMLERYGDLTDPQALARAAEAAVHNEARIKFVSAELNALAKATGRPRILAAAVKEYAAGIIARLPIKEMRPARYTAASTRAAKAAEKALAKGNQVEAVAEKRNQLINAQAAKQVYDARAEIDKTMALFTRIVTVKDDSLSRSRNMDLVNTARAILSAYGIGRAKNDPAGYMAALRRYDPALAADLEPYIAEATANTQPLPELSYERFLGLRDVIRQLWTLSRRAKVIEIDGKQVEIDVASGEMSARLDDIGVPDRERTEAVTAGERFLRGLSGLRAATRRVEHWAELLGQPFTRYVWQPVAEAADAYRLDKAAYMRRFLDLLEPIAPALKPYKIAATEIGYSFSGKSELLHAILHTGNTSNKTKLLVGRRWGSLTPDGALNTGRWDGFIARMHAEGVLTKADWDFAQAVWDLLDETKPLAQRAHHTMYGRYFAEVTADAVDTPFGQYRGGYVPAVTDQFLVQDAVMHAESEQLLAGDTNMFPSPARGFTKGRVENYTRELALDLRLLPQHLDKVLKFAHLGPPVRDVLRLLKAKGLANKLEKFDPVAMSDLLLPWLNRSVNQLVSTPSKGAAGKMADGFFRELRKRTGLQIMFANLTNALQQFTGFSVALVKVKPYYLRAGVWSYMRQPTELADSIAELSPFMSERMSSQTFEMNQAIDDIVLDPNKLDQAQAFFTRHGYFIQHAFQNVVDIVTWQGAFEQATAEGLDTREAVRAADAAVRQTQGAMNPEDIARIEAGPPAARLFTQFMTYFNNMANMLGTEYAGTVRDMGFKGAPRLLYVYVFGFAMPALLADLIVRAMKGEGDDEDDGWTDEFLDWFFGSQFRTAVAMVPIAGAASMTVFNTWNDKPYDDRIASSPSISALEGAARSPKSIYDAATGEGSTKKAIKDTLSAIGLATGLPVAVLGKPAGYVADVAEGKTKPKGPIDATRGVISGSGPRE